MSEGIAGSRQLGKNLADLIAAHGITAKKLAKEVRIPVSSIYRYINGYNDIPATRLKVFAAYFGITTDEMLEGV